MELTNYRRFKSSALEFSDGVIGILGMNGSGKSTIIEAIAWALYGNQPTIVRTQKEHLKRFGAAPSEPCEVKLGFELDGDKYQVNRRMTGKNYQTTAEVLVNGTSQASTTKGVTDLVEARLGMDYQAFYTSVFAKQKELNALSNIDPNKRKRLILRMLNIDSIDKAVINVRKDVREFDTRLKELRSTMVEDDGTSKIEVSKNKIKELDKKQTEVLKIINRLEKQKFKLEAKLRELEVSRNEQRKLKDDFNEISNQLTKIKLNIQNSAQQQKKLETELKDLKDQEKDLKKVEPKQKEWETVRLRKEELEEFRAKHIQAREFNSQLKQVEELHKTCYSELQKFQDELKKFDGLADNVKDCEEAGSKVNKEIEGRQKLISEQESKLEITDNEQVNLKAKLKEIQSLGADSECPTCERPLGEYYAVLENKFKSELSEIKDKRGEIEKMIRDETSALEDAKKRKDALAKREKHLSSQEKELARLEENIKNKQLEQDMHQKQRIGLETELKKFKGLKFDQKEYVEIKTRSQELEKVYERIITLGNNVKKLPGLKRELDELNKNQKKLTSEKNDNEKQLSSLKFDPDKLNDLEKMLDEHVRNLKGHELEMKEREGENKIINKELDQLKKLLEELEAREKRVQEYKSKLIYLNKLNSIMNKFKSYMISRIAPTLTQFASDLFRELTDGKYNRMEIDNDYNIFIYDQGEEFPLSRFSGGEEDLANLCLRLAISQVITAQAGTTGPSFVILDEIFGSQDVHRKRNLLAALNALSNKFRQIFLITHIEDVKDYIEYYVHVTENDDQTSKIEIIGN
jgi:exonuclease SbcC